MHLQNTLKDRQPSNSVQVVGPGRYFIESESLTAETKDRGKDSLFALNGRKLRDF